MNVQLLVIRGRPAGKALSLTCGNYYVGRGTECHIRPNSDWVSRQHCLLRITPQGAFLRDLASRNGTLVNGTLLDAECRLDDGDQIQVGPLVFEVRIEPRRDTSRPELPSLLDAGASPEPTADTAEAAALDVSRLPPLLPSRPA